MGENLNKKEFIGSLQTKAFTIRIRDGYKSTPKKEGNYEIDLKVRNNVRDNYTECVFCMEELIKLLEHNKSDICLKLLECLNLFLLELNKNSTNDNNIDIVEEKGSYSMRLYNILKTNDKEFEITLDELYSILSNKYKRYADFKKYVLEKSKKELEKSSDIIFTYEEIKTVRKVTSLKFHVKPNIKFNEEIAVTKEESPKPKFESKNFDCNSLKMKIKGQYK